MLARPRRSGDAGFTLVELLVALVVLGIIAAPLTSAIVAYFKTSATTSGRLTETRDEQIVSAFWQQDVASMGVRSPDFAGNTFALQQSANVAAPCASALPSGSSVINLAWSQYDTSGSGAQTLVTVSYIATGSSAPYTLIRAKCSGSAVTTTATLAADLAMVPSVTCADAAGALLPDCNGNGTNYAIPSIVNLKLSVASSTGKGQPYSVTLSGQRRAT